MAETIINPYKVKWEDVYSSLLVLADADMLVQPQNAEEWKERMEDLLAWEILRKEGVTRKPTVECPALTEWEFNSALALSMVCTDQKLPQLPKTNASREWYETLQKAWAIFIYAWHGENGINVKVQIERQ